MKKIKGNTWLYKSASCIGGYKDGNDILIIDTGNDGSGAGKALKGFESVNVKYIFNTHSHADHCGGNSYLMKKFSPVIISPAIEDSFINYPVLEPVYLYGSAPPSDMKNKFLCAAASKTDIVIKDNNDISLELGNNKVCFRLIPLKGHSPNMYGIITPDNIAFLGDALLGKEFLEKHGLIFSFDVKEHLDSLNFLRNVNAEGYVLAHGGYLDDINELITCNRESLENASALILDFLNSETKSFDDIHNYLYEKLGLKENLSLNVLNRSVIRAHVQYLHESGEAVLAAEKGRTVVRKK